MKLVIQIPCYNEENTILTTLKDLPEKIDGIDEIETVIVDDGSTDKTVEIVKEFGIKHIVRHPRNLGLAKAFMTGMTYALEQGADIIVNTDADNQYCSKDIGKLINPILKGEADIVIGERPILKIKSFSPIKKMFQKLGSFVMRILSDTDIQDAPSGFRAFSRDSALQINVFDKYTYTMETIIQAGAKGLKLQSVPIDVNPDLRKSKLVKNIFDYIKRSASTMIRMFMIYRPMKFFTSIACVFIILGIILGIRFLYYFAIGNGQGHVQSLILTAILLISGFQIGLIAVVSELISINRKLSEDIQKKLRILALDNKKNKE